MKQLNENDKITERKILFIKKYESFLQQCSQICYMA